jgi:trehalose/maltose hydrolase-like predicted phosphorylase
MAGSIDIVTRAFAGPQIRADTLTLTLDELSRLGFGLVHRNHCIDVTLDRERLRLAAHPCSAAPITIRIGDTEATVGGGQIQEFERAPRAPIASAVVPPVVVAPSADR